jgi:catechol-2,3-dioxygenase
MRILELTLLAPDVRAMRHFYEGTLGLGVVRADATGVTFEAGGTELTFERAGGGLRPFYHFAFNVTASRFPAAVEWIAARARVLGDGTRTTFSFPAWDADAVYFEDPAGNIVELIARHRLDETPRGESTGAAFGARDILGVSEIGLPVPAVDLATRALVTATDTPRWGRGSDAFTTLGDDHGLFVVVADRRGWYPTQRPAEMYPVRVTIEGRRERRLGIPGSPYLVVVRPAVDR